MTTLIPQFDLKNGGTTPTGAVNRAINLKLAETVSVKDFGAIGDGTTDDTVAIQAAINSVSTNGGSVYIPAGDYKVTAPLNLTNFANIQVTIHGDGQRNTKINATVTGHVFDCTGSQFLQFQDFAVWGTAYTAFLFARNSTGDSAGRNLMSNLEINGTWSISGFYNYGSEQFKAYGCTFINSANNCASVTIVRTNYNSVTSSFQTIATGGQSTTEYLFDGCTISSYATTGTSGALFLLGVSSIAFYKLFMTNEQPSSDMVRFDCTTYAPINVTFDDVMFDSNGTGATTGFHIIGTGQALAYLNINNVLDFANLTYFFYGDTGTSLESASIKNIQNTNQFTLYTMNYCDIDFGGTFLCSYSNNSNNLRVPSSASFTRLDFTYNNKIQYTDTKQTTFSGPVKITPSAWDTNTLQLGVYYFWVDASGKFRIKSGAPASDTDGTVVGTQT